MVRLLIISCLLAAGCHGSGSHVSSDADHDAPPDGWDAPVDADGPDVPPDTALDTLGDAACHRAPPCPEGPEDGVMGQPCITEMDCRDAGHAPFCITEKVEIWEGEVYVAYLGGACVLWAEESSGCDPDEEDTCPPGARCLEAGDWRACMDACTPADTSGDLFGWACGCRKGYQCDIGMQMCFPGCSNDRECCETWEDEDDDWRRDGDEVTFWDGCASWCDGDDHDEWADDCMASWECINPGRDGALIGDPCDHDSHCPRDGECLGYTDPDTDEVYFPGGYCTRMGCQYPGRGCEEDGGACINMGSFRERRGICMKPCHVGRDPSAPDYECRTTPGEEHVCLPMNVLGWMFGPPEEGEDGYCYPGNFAGGTGGIGTHCTSGTDCDSPLGLGECMEWFGDVPFCTIRCNEDLARDEAICGGTGPGGLATGLCGWGMCWEGCTGYTEPPGLNGCSRDDFACAPLSFLGSTYVVEGALRPPGVCIPACETDAFCEDIFDEGSTCDLLSGICS